MQDKSTILPNFYIWAVLRCSDTSRLPTRLFLGLIFNCKTSTGMILILHVAKEGEKFAGQMLFHAPMINFQSKNQSTHYFSRSFGDNDLGHMNKKETSARTSIKLREKGPKDTKIVENETGGRLGSYRVMCSKGQGQYREGIGASSKEM